MCAHTQMLGGHVLVCVSVEEEVCVCMCMCVRGGTQHLTGLYNI